MEFCLGSLNDDLQKLKTRYDTSHNTKHDSSVGGVGGWRAAGESEERQQLDITAEGLLWRKT